MTERKGQNLPLGYWLKRADELLTTRIDEAQRSNDLTRLDWQVLNVIHRAGTGSRHKIAETLRQFADASTVNATLDGLEERGLISRSNVEECELTSTGMGLYEPALSSQREIRQRAAAGISEDEYATTVSVLKRLVENVEQDSAA